MNLDYLATTIIRFIRVASPTLRPQLRALLEGAAQEVAKLERGDAVSDAALARLRDAAAKARELV